VVIVPTLVFREILNDGRGIVGVPLVGTYSGWQKATTRVAPTLYRLKVCKEYNILHTLIHYLLEVVDEGC
jgi:hypothetical protein